MVPIWIWAIGIFNLNQSSLNLRGRCISSWCWASSFGSRTGAWYEWDQVRRAWTCWGRFKHKVVASEEETFALQPRMYLRQLTRKNGRSLLSKPTMTKLVKKLLIQVSVFKRRSLLSLLLDIEIELEFQAVYVDARTRDDADSAEEGDVESGHSIAKEKEYSFTTIRWRSRTSRTIARALKLFRKPQLYTALHRRSNSLTPQPQRGLKTTTVVLLLPLTKALRCFTRRKKCSNWNWTRCIFSGVSVQEQEKSAIVAATEDALIDDAGGEPLEVVTEPQSQVHVAIPSSTNHRP